MTCVSPLLLMTEEQVTACADPAPASAARPNAAATAVGPILVFKAMLSFLYLYVSLSVSSVGVACSADQRAARRGVAGRCVSSGCVAALNSASSAVNFEGPQRLIKITRLPRCLARRRTRQTAA